MEITVEMVERLREKAPVSYAQAKEALEYSEGNLLDALIEAGAYPDITAEKEPDPIGDYNIPAEVEEMGGAPQREIGQADYDYVLGAVAYEAGETAEEPVRPQAVFTEIKGIPKADEIDSFVPEPVAGGHRLSYRPRHSTQRPPTGGLFMGTNLGSGHKKWGDISMSPPRK